MNIQITVIVIKIFILSLFDAFKFKIFTQGYCQHLVLMLQDVSIKKDFHSLSTICNYTFCIVVRTIGILTLNYNIFFKKEGFFCHFFWSIGMKVKVRKLNKF